MENIDALLGSRGVDQTRVGIMQLFPQLCFRLLVVI